MQMPILLKDSQLGVSLESKVTYSSGVHPSRSDQFTRANSSSKPRQLGSILSAPNFPSGSWESCRERPHPSSGHVSRLGLSESLFKTALLVGICVFDSGGKPGPFNQHNFPRKSSRQGILTALSSCLLEPLGAHECPPLPQKLQNKNFHLPYSILG